MAVNKYRLFELAVVLLLLVAGCDVEHEPPLKIPPRPSPTATTQAPVVTPQPARVLSVCLGQEPQSLFLYDSSSRAARAIRQALFDGPFDEVGFQFIPVILERVPTLENGDVDINQVEVQPGERMVDASGNRTYLAEGEVYRPAGCYSTECEEVYRGQEPVMLDQVSILFRITPGVEWSDGTPLQGEDSVFSFRVAQDLYGEFGPDKLRYAQEYAPVDRNRVEWRGIPGYQGITSYADFFFTPLPRHRWQELDTSQILRDQRARKDPLGWGPYVIQEWLPGDHLTVVENERYFRRAAGFPYYDHIVFRFFEDVSGVLDAFRARECEVALGVPGLVNEIPVLEQGELRGSWNVVHLHGGAWNQVVFGIQSLEDGSPLFQDTALRQAFATCINRRKMIAQLPEAPRIADSFYPPRHPSFESDLPRYRYDPDEAARLLEEIGWQDDDNDATTPRTAQNVEGVEDGSPLQVSLLVSRSERAGTIAGLIQDDLARCGVDVKVSALPSGELLAPGPDGPIFGRNFDMAHFAWTPANYRLCSLFLSSEIPGPYPDFPKGWGGGNASGYANEEYDASCRAANTLLPEMETRQEAVRRAQLIFGEEIPALPLYFRQDVMIADNELSGMEDGYFSPLWNVESLP